MPSASDSPPRTCWREYLARNTMSEKGVGSGTAAESMVAIASRDQVGACPTPPTRQPGSVSLPLGTLTKPASADYRLRVSDPLTGRDCGTGPTYWCARGDLPSPRREISHRLLIPTGLHFDSALFGHGVKLLGRWDGVLGASSLDLLCKGCGERRAQSGRFPFTPLTCRSGTASLVRVRRSSRRSTHPSRRLERVVG